MPEDNRLGFTRYPALSLIENIVAGFTEGIVGGVRKKMLGQADSHILLIQQVTR